MAKDLVGTLAFVVAAVLFASCGGGISKSAESTAASTSATSAPDAIKCGAAVRAANADPDAVGVTARQNVAAIENNCTRSQFDKIAAEVYKQDPKGLFSVSPPKEWVSLICGDLDGSGKKAGLLVCQ